MQDGIGSAGPETALPGEASQMVAKPEGFPQATVSGEVVSTDRFPQAPPPAVPTNEGPYNNRVAGNLPDSESLGVNPNYDLNGEKEKIVPPQFAVNNSSVTPSSWKVKEVEEAVRSAEEATGTKVHEGGEKLDPRKRDIFIGIKLAFLVTQNPEMLDAIDDPDIREALHQWIENVSANRKQSN